MVTHFLKLMLTCYGTARHMSAVRCFTCARKGFTPRARETHLFVETMGGGRTSISGVKVQRLTNNFFILQQFHVVDKMFLAFW